MFDPSDTLQEYFRLKGYSELEACRAANQVSSQCIVHRAKQPERQPVSLADKNNMENTQTATPDSEIIDFGFEVTDADVARPVLQGGQYDAEISFVREEKSRVKGTPQVHVGYRLTQEAKDVNGKTISPGFTLVQRINRKPSGKQTQEMIDNQIKRIHFAAAGKGAVNSGLWVGKPVRILVSLREPHTDESGNSYDASNDVRNVSPAKS